MFISTVWHREAKTAPEKLKPYSWAHLVRHTVDGVMLEGVFSQVVLVDLEILAEISSSRVAHKFPLSQKIDETLRLSVDVQQRLGKSTHGRLSSYFTHFMISLMKLFSTDRQLLDDRGSFIIRFAPPTVSVIYVLCVVCNFNIAYVQFVNFVPKLRFAGIK